MGGGSQFLSPEPGTIIWTFITFVVLLVLLRAFAWKPILGVLEEREKLIKGSLDEARKAKEEAERHLADSRDAMKKGRQELAAVMEKGQKEAERFRQELMAKAQAEADEARKRGIEEIERQKRAAVAEIRAATVDLAIQVAGRVVQSSVDEKTQRKLAGEFLAGMGDASRRS